MTSLKNSKKDELINLEDPSKILHKIPNRYLRSIAILNYKKKADLFVSKSNQPDSKPLLLKKYFGKKITFIDKSSKLFTSPSCYKKVKSITFNQFSEENEKWYYDLKIQSTLGLVVLKNDFFIDKKVFWAFILRTKAWINFKGCENIRISEYFPRKIRPFINSICIPTIYPGALQIFKKKLWPFLLRLKCLKRLNLKFDLECKTFTQKEFRNLIKVLNQLNFPQY